MTKDTDNAKPKDISKYIKLFTGTSNELVGEELLDQVTRSLFIPKSAGKEYKDRVLQAALSLMHDIAPKDPQEGVLVTQMVATHNAAMECLRRAALENQSFGGLSFSLTQAQKLMRLYLDQMKALNKYRGKGDQKVVIEHVNVAPGAQAIVGNVEMANKDFGSAAMQAIPSSQQQPLDIDASTKKEKAGTQIKNAKRKKQT